MDFNVEIRKKQVESIGDFVNKSREQVYSIISSLEWTPEKLVSTSRNVVNCTINPEHLLFASTSKEHIAKCRWKHEGYTIEDQPLSEPRTELNRSIFIDDVTKQKIFYEAMIRNPNIKLGWLGPRPIPRTADRLIATYTPDERLELYNYATSLIKQQKAAYSQANKTKKDELERIQKDLDKRRERNYNDKSPVNNKRYSNVLRDLIQCQMDMLKSRSRSISQTKSRSRSRSRRRSRSRSRNRHSGRSRRRYRSRTRSRTRSRSREIFIRRRQWFNRNRAFTRRISNNYRYRVPFYYRRFNSPSPVRSFSRSHSLSRSRTQSISSSSISSLSSYCSNTSAKQKERKK